VTFLTVGNGVIEWAAPMLGLRARTALLLQAARVGLGLVGISVAFALLYWQGPNVRQQFRWITPGSALATLALVLLALGFGLYVNLVGAASYAKTYGTAFGLILFLYFLYLASQVIVLGAELNAETTKRYDPETIRDKLTDPRKQLPGEQPAPHPEAAREAGVSPSEVAATNTRSAERVAAATAAGGGSPEAAYRGRDQGGDGRAAGPETAPRGGASGGASGGVPGAGGAPHPDRTRVVTLALAGAAVAGAFAVALLPRDRRDRRD
jgi:Virulence factor BrkB